MGCVLLLKIDVTLTNISNSLPHIMAGEQLRRYGMQKLRHCHPLYSVLRRITAEFSYTGESDNRMAGQFVLWSFRCSATSFVWNFGYDS